MVRSLFVLSAVAAVATAQGNMESFPSVSNDLSHFNTASFLNNFPSGTLVSISSTGTVYPTGTSSSAPVYGSPAPSSSGTAAPVATETGGPVYGGPSSTGAPETMATTYVSSSSAVSSYAAPTAAANSTAAATTPSPTASGAFQNSGNTFTVKLPVVLGALGLVFAML